MSTTNMNIRPSKKYGFSREEVEKRALESETFRTVYNMHRLEKTHKLNLRQDRYDKKSMLENEKRENLNIGEKVYVLVEKIKKKSSYSTMIEEKKGKYSFITAITDANNKKGTHWWSILNIEPKNELFFFNSYGLDGPKHFIIQDDRKIID